MTNKAGISTILSLLLMVICSSLHAQHPTAHTYLDTIKSELQKKWPHNRTVNVVFHGHSVPSGYFTGGVVNTIESYPYLTLKKVKQHYPFAVVNAITTSIGGEQSEQGALRFKNEVLSHRPDVLFIDYALNDRSIGLERAKAAWIKMIEEGKLYETKIILLTPTPDLKEDILTDDAPLAKHSEQIRSLARQHNVGLIDSYALFKAIAKDQDLKQYMAQNNHINEKGHELVAVEILRFFETREGK
jgi:acyl-CoA thioesterase I